MVYTFFDQNSAGTGVNTHVNNKSDQLLKNQYIKKNTNQLLLKKLKKNSLFKI